MGMPGLFVSTGDGDGGRWHFHAVNVEAWFQNLTAQRMKNPEKLVEKEGLKKPVKERKRKKDVKKCK